uniref:Uncharacterized protein n=1 Tax=Physcomitrium patens TaxID=3218 RepID=A0A2K1KJQ4_PHYPA|nr:hypothetical protein PHYPA_007687 [Physcomitrium patens]
MWLDKVRDNKIAYLQSSAMKAGSTKGSNEVVYEDLSSNLMLKYLCDYPFKPPMNVDQLKNIYLDILQVLSGRIEAKKYASHEPLN